MQHNENLMSAPTDRMTPEERRAGASLASIFALRMLGLFLILPVFSVYAKTLPGGGMIRDAGKELFFSAHDKTAEAVALRYAEKKWGKDVQMEGNKIFRDTSREIAHGWRQEQRQGPER